MSTYNTKLQIRFAHCDAAGIVYYPRYVELFAQVIEEWIDRALGFSFHDIHIKNDWGMPIVHMEYDFLKPSFLSDWLTFELQLEKIGNTSFISRIMASTDGEVRAKARLVQVMRSFSQPDNMPIPAELRSKMELYLAES